MEIYKDMLEKLKYHKQLIMNAFIRNNYYPSNDEVMAAVQQINARLSLFEAYISKPGDYFNPTEINYCFEMMYKDIQILYQVLESILTNEYAQLKLYIEATLTELEAKADYFYKRCAEETNSTTLGKTLVFEANSWNITTEDQLTIIDLGNHDFVEGSTIACFANVNNIDNKSITFKFTSGKIDETIVALPYNLYDNITYKIPGELKVIEKEIKIGSNSIVNDKIKINYDLIQGNNYKFCSGKNYMVVTYKTTGRTDLVEFPFMSSYNFLAVQDCFVEFYIVDGNINDNSNLEYNFNMAPRYQNFSLQDGFIRLDKDIKRIHIDAQKGLTMSFRYDNGTSYAECLDPIILDNHTLLYNGNIDVRDITIREYVRDDLINYNVKVYIDSIENAIDSIDSIYIKELD
jgi:hypothetical protein